MNRDSHQQSRRHWLANCAPLLLGACSTQGLGTKASNDPLSRLSATSFESNNIAWIEQDEYQCGPAALAMALNQAGANNLRYDDVVRRTFTPGRSGSLQLDMLAAPRAFGFVSYPIQSTIQDLLELNLEQHSPIVLLNLSVQWLPLWHYALITGHNTAQRSVYITSGTSAREEMSISTFMRLWERADCWAMTVRRPGNIPSKVTAEAAEVASVAFERINPVGLAIQQWEALTRRWPQRLLPWLGLSHAQIRATRWDQALVTLMHTTQHFDSAVAWNNLSEVYSAKGDRQRALHAINRGLDIARSKEPSWIEALEKTRASIQE